MNASKALCEVWFYHLERASLDQILPELLEKTLARGWRAIVRAPSPERIDHLDARLWSYRDDSFLAHGIEGEPLAEHQPILLASSEANANNADVLFLIDGAETRDLAGFERCILIFDGSDESAVAKARQRWTEMKSLGHGVAYWRQSPQAWEKVGGLAK